MNKEMKYCGSCKFWNVQKLKDHKCVHKWGMCKNPIARKAFLIVDPDLPHDIFEHLYLAEAGFSCNCYKN